MDPLRLRLFGAVFAFTRQLTAGLIPDLTEFRVEQQTMPHRESDLQIEISDRLMNALIKFASTQPELGVKESDIRSHVNFVQQRLQEEIATARFGIDVGNRLALEHDEQMLRALDSLPQAKQLVENLRNGRRSRN